LPRPGAAAPKSTEGTMHDQKLSLRLLPDRGLLIVRRANKGGWGTKERWKIGEKSNVPKALYFIILNFVRQRVKRCENKKDFASLKKCVLRALCEAGEVCGCEPQFGKEGADVVWYLEDIPLIGFHVAKAVCKKRKVRELLAGKTVFRWTIAVAESGYFHILARTTNPRYRFDAPRKEGKHPFVDGHWLRQGRGV
jgi:hypothetical protein